MLNSTPARKRVNLVCLSGHKPTGSKSRRFKLRYRFLIEIIIVVENSRNNRHQFVLCHTAENKFHVFLSFQFPSELYDLVHELLVNKSDVTVRYLQPFNANSTSFYNSSKTHRLSD